MIALWRRVDGAREERLSVPVFVDEV